MRFWNLLYIFVFYFINGIKIVLLIIIILLNDLCWEEKEEKVLKIGLLI